MLAIHKRFQVTIGRAKTYAELFALIFAVLLSGPIGLGSIFTTFFTDPVIQFFHSRMKKIYVAAEQLVERT